MHSICQTKDLKIQKLLLGILEIFQFGNGDSEMLIDPSAEQTTSWKDKVVGQSSKSDGNGVEEEEDCDLLEGDIQKSVVNGIPSIEFLDRVHQILIGDMENTVILKLLGRNIGYSILQNKVYSLWKPSSSFYLMDIENGYFLAKFQNKLDYEKILSGGPWIIFGQYLIVQPWTVAFNPAQAFSKVVMSWIRLPGLSGYLYKWKILVEIGGMIGKVAKLDMNTDNKAIGRFA